MSFLPIFSFSLHPYLSMSLSLSPFHSSPFPSLSLPKACSPWAEEGRLWPKPAGGGVYTLEDYQCEEFQGLATTEELSAQAKLEQRQALLSLLDKNWDTG